MADTTTMGENCNERGYKKYTELTLENHDSLLSVYRKMVGELLSLSPYICQKYPDVPEIEVSSYIYQQLDRVTPLFRS